jgi:hypothetical protein
LHRVTQRNRAPNFLLQGCGCIHINTPVRDQPGLTAARRFVNAGNFQRYR